MDFKKFLSEEKRNTIVVLNGRMTPVTVGHAENVKGLKKLAKEHNADHLVIATHSHDMKTKGADNKNPLTPEEKEKHLRRAFPDTNIKMTTRQKPSIFHQLSDIHKQGYKHVIIASGEDRTEDYERVKQYNGVKGAHGYYNFKSIGNESTGERQEGISGTDMRKHAASGNFDKFREGLAPNIAKNEKHSRDIYNDVRHGMHVNEDYENPNRFDWGTPEGTNHAMSMTPGMEPDKIICPAGEAWSKEKGMCVSIREAYIANEIFKLGQIVESNKGDAGEIVYRGSTYVTIQLESGKTVKHWLKDIKESNKVININRLPSKVNENSVPIRKIPALLMSKEQLHEMTKNNLEISYEGYKTENLHMCPDASIQLKSLIARAGVSPKFVLQAIMATDQYLGIEKQAIADGFADEHTVHQFAMKLSIAHDTLNALEYPDKQLTYMTKHIQNISKLSMHRDGTFANETGLITVETQPEGQGGGVEEGYDTADYRIVIGKDGKKHKVPAGRIITDRKEDMKENTTPFASFRELISNKKVNEQAIEPPESPTHARDINFKDEKDVFHGIDKHIEGQSVDGKPVGMVSFKAFMNAPETQKIAAQHAKDRQDVHRGQVEIAQQHSPAYKQMTKAAKQDL